MTWILSFVWGHTHFIHHYSWWNRWLKYEKFKDKCTEKQQDREMDRHAPYNKWLEKLIWSFDSCDSYQKMTKWNVTSNIILINIPFFVHWTFRVFSIKGDNFEILFLVFPEGTYRTLIRWFPSSKRRRLSYSWKYIFEIIRIQ